MTYTEVEKFMQKKRPGNSPVQISFSKRKSLKGLFIKMADYDELSRKNLWRIVSEMNIESYQASKDSNLARIFNGSEFTRLEVLSPSE